MAVDSTSKKLSMSSRVLYICKLIRQECFSPTYCINGSAQCCPARIAILCSARYSAISCECIPATTKLNTPTRFSALLDPMSVTFGSFSNFSSAYTTSSCSIVSSVLYPPIFSIYSKALSKLTAQERFGVPGSNLSGRVSEGVNDHLSTQAIAPPPEKIG